MKMHLKNIRKILGTKFILNIYLLTLTSFISIGIFILLCFLLSDIVHLKENIDIKRDLSPDVLLDWRPEPYERLFYLLGIVFIPSFSIMLLVLLKNLILKLNINVGAALRFPIKQKISKITHSKFNLLKDVIFVSLIIFFTFNENLDNYLIIHETTYILATVNDILHHKFMLVDTYSQYGLLNMYFLAFIFKFIPLTYRSIYLLTSIGFVIEYLIIYFLFRSFLKPLFALFALLFTFYYSSSFPYFTVFDWRVPLYTNVTGSLIRFVPFFSILTIYLLDIKKKINNPVWPYMPFILSGIFFFWSFDIGSAVFISVLIVSFINLLLNGVTKRNISILLKRLLIAFASLVVTGLIIIFATKFFSGYYPDWSMFTKYVKIYSAGFGMLPIPKFNLSYYAILAMYLMMLYYLFFIIMLKIKVKMFAVLSFITIYGIIHFNYYLGRSHDWVLPNVSLPALIIFVYFSKTLLYDLYFKQKNRLLKRIILIYAIIPILVIFYTIPKIIAMVPKVLFSFHEGFPLLSKKIDFSKIEIFKSKGYLDTAQIINKFSEGNNKVALLMSPDYRVIDAVLLLETKKTNTMPVPILHSLLLESDRIKVLAKIKQVKPKYILIEDTPLVEKYVQNVDLTNGYYLGIDKSIKVYFRNDIKK